MTISQFEIYHAFLEPHEGSEQGGSRPVLVVSRTSINRSLPVIAVLPITSCKPGRRVYSTEVLIPAGTAGLTVDSLILAHQVRTISITRLQKPYGLLDSQILQEKIRKALRVFLDL
ncbi:MAG: type II toxin-antitoxin system PemK/MazF family toxin [Vulcanimicrobiota bacterium]